MLRGSLFVRLTTSAYQRFANAATVSVARPARAARSACLASRPATGRGQPTFGTVPTTAARGQSCVRGIHRASRAPCGESRPPEPVLHAPDLLAGRLHLKVKPAAIGKLVALLSCLQTLEFRVGERHACPTEKIARAPRGSRGPRYGAH